MANFDPIGTALSNPLVLGAGKWFVNSGTDVIVASVIDILGTAKGETFLNEEYGSRLEELLFAPNDAVTFSIIKQFVFEALNQWEQRIRVDSVEVSSSEDDKIKVLIHISFTVVNTNLQDSFVFPFYERLAA